MSKKALPFGNAMGMKVAFSNAVAVDISNTKKMVSVSGQLAIGEENKIVGVGSMRLQTEQCIKNIASALEAFGGTLDDIISVTVFVKNMSNLSDIHEVRLQYFKEPYPTSTLVQITEFVNSEALIEIEALAILDRE